MSKEKKIFVERETYTKNEKQYFTYFINGNIRGRDVRIAIMPPADGAKADFNGYMVTRLRRWQTTFQPGNHFGSSADRREIL